MSERRLRILVVGFIFLLGFGLKDFVVAYRPFGTEDAGVAGKGIFQSEISWDYLRWNDGKVEGFLLFVPVYGISDQLELSAEIFYMLHNLQASSLNAGVGDINLVAKYLVAPEGGPRPAFTLKSIVKMDNGDYNGGHGSGDKDWSLFAACSKMFGPVILHAHLGYSWVGKAKNNNLRDISLYGLAFDYTFTSPLHLVCEVNGNRHPDSTETEDPRNWLLGATFKASDKVTFDVASKWGISNASPNWNLTSGASITF